MTSLLSYRQDRHPVKAERAKRYTSRSWKKGTEPNWFAQLKRVWSRSSSRPQDDSVVFLPTATNPDACPWSVGRTKKPSAQQVRNRFPSDQSDRGQLDYAFTPYYAKSMSDFLQSVRDELSCCCWDHHHQVHEVRHPIYRFRASISADISVSSHFPQFHNEFGYLRYYVHICLQFDTHHSGSTTLAILSAAAIIMRFGSRSLGNQCLNLLITASSGSQAVAYNKVL